MAQRKDYLQSQRAFGIRSKGIAWGVLSLCAIVIIVLVANLYTVMGATPAFGAVCLLALCALVWLTAQVWPVIRRSALYVKRYSSGIAGEQAVWKELYNLPAGYRAYHDLLLGKNMTNIDFIVTGPCGVVAVEAKNHYGRVTTNGVGVLINGRPTAVNMLGQAGFEAKSLAEFLEAKATGKIYVASVLVFANPKTYVDVPGQPHGVHVLHLRQLISFLSKWQGMESEATIQRVNNLLDLLVKR